MKKYIRPLGLALLLSGSLLTAYQPVETKVFICDSRGGSVYHRTKSCHGLNACTHEIIEVTIPQAKEKYKERPCKICY